MNRLTLALAVCLLSACQSTTSVGDDLAALDGATPYTATAHMRDLWNKLEACSGLKGDFDKVQWYTSPRLVVRGQHDLGMWLPGVNIIVLRDYVVYDTNFVGNGHDLDMEHEMMHALLRGGSDHPPKYFNGVCGWLVP